MGQARRGDCPDFRRHSLHVRSAKMVAKFGPSPLMVRRMSITLNLLIIAALVLLSGLFAAAGTAVAMARHGPLQRQSEPGAARARRPACGGALRDGCHGHWRRAVDRAAERPPGGLADRPLGGEPCGRRLDGSGRRPDGGDPRPRRPCPRANRAQPSGGGRPLAAAAGRRRRGRAAAGDLAAGSLLATSAPLPGPSRAKGTAAERGRRSST